MPCYGPITGYYAAAVNPTGKRSLVFRRELAWSDTPVMVPCGRCIGCRLERSRQWAMRCMHEKQMYDVSSFVTLTYAEEFEPPGGSLCLRDLQLFMKRLRKRFGTGIRFYGAGEYGDGTLRPHYHLLLFNLDFPNKQVIAKAKGGQSLFTSDALSDLWPIGHHWIGEVTFESCAYVARYIIKKINGAPATDHYQVMTEDGELIDRVPEFQVYSKGIGEKWFDRYHKSVYSSDSVIVRGAQCKPPRFYDERYELLDKIKMETIRRNRRRRALKRKADSTTSRLRVRELVERRKLAFFAKRSFQ